MTNEPSRAAAPGDGATMIETFCSTNRSYHVACPHVLKALEAARDVWGSYGTVDSKLETLGKALADLAKRKP